MLDKTVRFFSGRVRALCQLREPGYLIWRGLQSHGAAEIIDLAVAGRGAGCCGRRPRSTGAASNTLRQQRARTREKDNQTDQCQPIQGCFKFT